MTISNASAGAGRVPVVTTETVAGHEITETLGLVHGSTVRTRHVGSDIVAGLRNLVGGEVPEYTAMMAGAREQALDRISDQARALGADAVVTARFTTAMLMHRAAEVLVTGTAVRLRPARTAVQPG